MVKPLCLVLFMIAASLELAAQKNQPVRFAGGTEIFPENFASIVQNPGIKPSEILHGQYVRYIQMGRILNAQERAAFEAAGPRILGYVSFGAYLVAIPQQFDFQRIAPFFPQSIVPVRPDWKLANTLRERPFGKWAVHGNWLDVNLQVYALISIEEGASLCREQGWVVLKAGIQNGYLQVRLPQDKIEAAAALPFVQYLELAAPPPVADDLKARNLHRANLLDSDAALGNKYNGEGVQTLVRDDGPIGPHIDFAGRLDNLNTVPTDYDVNHADWVGGCVGAAGNIDPKAKGMATGSKIYAIDYQADFQDETMALVQSEGITLTNTSYSEACNGGYTLNSQTVDQQLFENPSLMHVFSAGNSNETDCDYGAGIQWGNITGGHKLAKNGLVVANIDANELINNKSSRGPATDGRLKPDIAAFGVGVYMTAPNNLYNFSGGTSFSAPLAMGNLAQLTQAYKSIYQTQPSAALLKAAVLNTAKDLGNTGPDFKYGWGSLQANLAYTLLEQHQWLEGDADQGSDLSHTLQIPANVREARIMVYWADPPATENTAKALINDLDLRVSDGSGTDFLPWKLDPTPNPIILDMPAGKGRDSLNNMEQVVLNDPSAGAYTIRIKGTEVPMGPQHYYLVWHFIYDNIQIVYPNGGEGFAPGDPERILWDAYGNTDNFILQYSTNGGQSYQPLATVSGDRRYYDWAVPNTASGQVLISIQRGILSDSSDQPFTIVGVPQNLQVTKVCPDSITFSWNKINDTLSYDAYLLGNKYMEIKGTTNANSYTIPIQNAGEAQWLSVRASHSSGIVGRRAIAISWAGGLLNCPQDQDLVATQLISPSGDALISCGSSSVQIRARIHSEGLNPSSGGTIFYQANGQQPVGEALPAILAGASLDYTFQTPLTLTSNASLQLKIWVQQPGDEANFNDTISATFPVVLEASNQPYLEDFESSAQLPDGWAIVNPDGALTWELTDNLPIQVVGPNDVVGRSLYVNFYDYEMAGQEDFLYVLPVDLQGFDNPNLNFDLAHARYSVDNKDGLRVEVFGNCNLTNTPVTIWEKKDPDLATVPDENLKYYPTQGTDWRHESVNLGAFAGQKIFIRFVAENDYGNLLYLDNIGILSGPLAEFMAPDTVCRLDTVVFQAVPGTNNPTYNWNFGLTASPGTATGIGPHQVVYSAPGNKTVRLTVSNSIGADTVIHPLNVRPLSTANFSVVQNGLTATFTNTSQNANTYLWDFGDGNTSMEANPVHTYAVAGTYPVKLTAGNGCSSSDKTLTVGVTGTQELSDKTGIRILPNPNNGQFEVVLERSIDGRVEMTLRDNSGREIIRKESLAKQAGSRIAFHDLDLPKGIYQLQVRFEEKQALFQIVVQ